MTVKQICPMTYQQFPYIYGIGIIQNRTGKLRSVPEEALRIALLPRTKITISDLGIKAFGLFYLAKEIT